MACADLPNVVATGHIFGGGHPGGYDLKFELGRDFCTVHLPAKFHHPMFARSEVIMLTNKQTDAAENIQRSLLRYDGG